MRIGMMTDVLLHYMNQEEAIRTIKKLGYEAGDITFINAMDDNDEMMKGDYLEHARYLRKVADEIELPLIQAHSPFPIHIDGNEEYNKKMIEVTKKVLEICGILGIRCCVIHPNNNWDAKTNKERFFDLIYPTAEKAGVIIATENMWNWEKGAPHCTYAACSTPEDFLLHCEVMNKPFFKACVDIGHAAMFQTFDPNVSPRKMIEKLGHKYVACLHIHDNDMLHDDHFPIHFGRVDWDEVVTALKNINYDGDLMSEFVPRKMDNLDEILLAHSYQRICLLKLRNDILKK